MIRFRVEAVRSEGVLERVLQVLRHRSSQRLVDLSLVTGVTGTYHISATIAGDCNGEALRKQLLKLKDVLSVLLEVAAASPRIDADLAI